MKQNGSKPTVVPALEKAFDILEYIGRRGASVTIKEISVDLGIPSATTYRTVRYLCRRKYLKENQPAEGGYILGPQLLYLAQLITRQSNLITEAEPIMRDLAARSGQTTQLGVLQDSGVIYIQQLFPATPVNIIASLRTVISVNVSACGKALVAYLPPSEQNHFLKNAKLPAQTSRSIVDLDQFRLELAKVKDCGYALDNEEYARGIGCAAAPIYDYRGQVVAAIGITGHIADYNNAEKREYLIQLVKDAASEISRNLGVMDLSE